MLVICKLAPWSFMSGLSSHRIEPHTGMGPFDDQCQTLSRRHNPKFGVSKRALVELCSLLSSRWLAAANTLEARTYSVFRWCMRSEIL